VTSVVKRQAMIRQAIVVLAGALFGTGLLVSGMTSPAKVIGFLDVTGDWDPSLAFVMAGAVAVYSLVFSWISRRGGNPWFDSQFHLPTRRDLDLPLVAGAALFGLGWGLAGWCPGPGIVSAASGSVDAIVFVVAMLAGMYAHQRWSTRVGP